MSDIRYHQSQVENKKDSYGAYDILDFVVSFENRKLNCGSIRFQADVVLMDGTSPNTVNKKTYIDGLVGAHSFIGSLGCQTMNQGSVENILNYPKIQSIISRSTMTEQDTFNSGHVCELMAPNELITNLLLKGTCQGALSEYNVNKTTDCDFSVKLITAFNSPVNDPLLPYSVSGDIRYTIQLPNELGTLWGDSTIGSTIKYQLKNCLLTYQTFDDDGKKSPSYMFGVKGLIESVVLSNTSNFSTKYPMVCNAVVSTFIPQEQERSNKYNPYKCHQLPNVQRVEYLFNDSSNSYITYSIDNSQDLLQEFVDALSVGSGNKSDLTLSNLASNQAYGIGLKFAQPLDLNSQKLSINIYSDVNSTSPYSMSTMFFGMITL